MMFPFLFFKDQQYDIMCRKNKEKDPRSHVNIIIIFRIFPHTNSNANSIRVPIRMRVPAASAHWHGACTNAPPAGPSPLAGRGAPS